MSSLCIAIAQINTTLGDISGNVEKIVASIRSASDQGADLVVFPEMAITGYPPEDLVFKSSFQDRAMEAATQIAQQVRDTNCAALVGGLYRDGYDLYNAVFLIDEGKIQRVQSKRSLPNYGVFDEKRLFSKGDKPSPIEWRGHQLGVLICQDVWDERLSAHLNRKGAEILIVLNASPYEMGKARTRKNVVELAARQMEKPVIYVNLVGGQDELVFDGRSFAIHPDGSDVTRLKAFQEELGISKWEKKEEGWRCVDAPMIETQNDMETVYQAMVLGLRDYVNKNGFKGVVVGLSGGIDSGLTAAVAVDALGPERVHGVLLPSPYTSRESVEDASQLSELLGIRFDTIPITSAMESYKAMLKDVFDGHGEDTTEENIQARIRGNILMAISNKFGSMVLTTGNKSEMSVGYATLYGDMCGGYSVLKDVYKTTVFKLSRWRNEYKGDLVLLDGKAGRVIPERMITKPPSAELKPDQKDEDTLPPYDLLDAILRGLIEDRYSIRELVDQGHDLQTVARVAKMIYTAEYKRRQAPPGVKVSGMSFGRDRRYPITNKWIWQSVTHD
ncbi:MAG: NAD+ synthase [Rickettsiales bacterium]|nr:NAD+ synthase [Rickettsiales bacterium]